ncbi:MAG TPA: DNA-binding protein [Conexivisphaerales archaeon]|nr:DNA-binding protein [Conexivisphaerales archaeon]
MSVDRDPDVDIIMKKKLLELQRRAALNAKPKPEPKAQPKDPRAVVLAMLYDRGDEVLEAAETQYPEETKMIVEKVADLIEKGKLQEKISGGALLWLFRQVGMRVHIETTIRIQQDGKMVSVADKLKQGE